MKRQLLFVHGGGEGAYEEDRKMAASLRDALGSGYEVRCPKMPEEDSPQYTAWRDRIASELDELDGEVFLVGHSLGASILLKYISEEKTVTPIAGMFLVAPPYWSVEDWEVDEYVLQEDFASTLPRGLPMFVYHSRDDEWVPSLSGMPIVSAHGTRWRSSSCSAAVSKMPGGMVPECPMPDSPSCQARRITASSPALLAAVTPFPDTLEP